MRKNLLAVLTVVAMIFSLAPSSVLSQPIIPNNTFFPDLEKQEVAACAQQANAYATIALMRDSNVPKAKVVEKLIKERGMKSETAIRVVESVYAFPGSAEHIRGQIMGECLTTLSYEKLIRQSKYI